ncbi:MAG: cysteine desulfurase family protein, partial [Eubacteriales bacterium]
DLVTVSAHKIHGPKGVGALYISPYCIKRRTVSPVIFGGGQESNFRSGTENMPGIAGFGAAAEEGMKTLQADISHMASLRDYIADKLAADETLSQVHVNLPQSEMRAPHILSIRLPKIKSETMLNYLSGRGIAVSSGSACAAQSGRVSNALMRFGLSENDADTTLRISLCAENTTAEADIFLDALRTGIGMLAKMKR